MRPIVIAVCALLALGLFQPASAQIVRMAEEAPPARLLVGYKPGGITDAHARAMARVIAPLIERDLRVVNRPGANQTEAIRELLAAADTDEGKAGDVFFFGAATAITVTPLLDRRLDAGPEHVIVAGALSEFQMSLAAPADAPYADMAGLVRHARARGEIAFASLNPMAEMLIRAVARRDGLGVALVNVNGRKLAELLYAGQADVGFTNGLQAHYPARMKTLASAASRRLALFPAAPTLQELGYGKIGLDAPLVLLLPRTAAPEAVKRIATALKAASADPDVLAVAKATATPVAYLSPEAATARVEAAAAAARRLYELTYPDGAG